MTHPPWEQNSSLKTADALVEIEGAIRDAFPNASRVTARADRPSVLVQFAHEEKPVSVQFSEETLKAYRRRDDALRLRALTTSKLVCNFAFAREYAANDDPMHAFVIDAEMALSG